MTKSHKTLYASIALVILVLLFFLTRVVKNFGNITTSPTDEPILSDNSFELKIYPNDLALGNPGAQNTIVEYADLNDSRSRNIHKLISDFVTQHPRDIRLIFKHAPVSHLFGDGVLAHEAAYCAGQQIKTTTKTNAPQPMLWAFIDAIITNRYNLKESGLRKAATDVSLNSELWWTCTNSEKAKEMVARDINDATQLGAGKPPLIFINNRKLNTSLDFDVTEILTTAIQK